MTAGILIKDQEGNVIFDGTQRIPKILLSVVITKEVQEVRLPRPINGELYYYHESTATDQEPYYYAQGQNFKVDVVGMVVTITQIKIRPSIPVTLGFKVNIGEY